ncbi:MAG: hypothetical protein OXB94_13040 [Nitrospira sp.]|nr:hypothetical protein [Nitrospira sp.]
MSVKQMVATILVLCLINLAVIIYRGLGLIKINSVLMRTFDVAFPIF